MATLTQPNIQPSTTIQSQSAPAGVNKNYSATDFTEKILNALSKVVLNDYEEYALLGFFKDGLIANKADFISKIETKYNELVALSRQEGYDLDANFYVGSDISKFVSIVINPKPASIPTTVAQKEKVYDDAVLRIIAKLDDIKTKITKPSQSIANNIDQKVKDLLTSYHLDADDIIANDASVQKLIADIKSAVISDFKNYEGTTFTGSTEFYDKAGYDATSAVNNTLNTYQGLDAIISTAVKLAFIKELNALSIKAGATDRDLNRLVYNTWVNNMQTMSPDDIDSSLLPGFKALINKYSVNGKIDLSDIYVIADRNKREVDVRVSLNVTYTKPGGASSTTLSVIKRPLTLPKYEYAIVEMSSIAWPYFSSSSSTFYTTTDWTKVADVKSEILNTKYSASVDWSGLFRDLDKYTTDHPNASYVVAFENGNVVLNFMDSNIKATDFEYSTPTEPKDADVFYFRDQTHEYSVGRFGQYPLTFKYIEPSTMHVTFENTNNIFDKVKDSLKNAENSWEDNSPSDLIHNPSSTATPTRAELQNIYGDLGNVLQEIDHNLFALTIKQNSEEHHNYDVSGESIFSWNSIVFAESSIGSYQSEFEQAFNIFLLAVKHGVITTTSDLQSILNIIAPAITSIQKYKNLIGESLMGIIPSISLENESRYINVNMNLTNDDGSKTEDISTVYVHYLSYQDRVVEARFLKGMVNSVFEEQIKNRMGMNQDVPKEFMDRIIARIQPLTDTFIGKVETKLKINDPTAEIPDWELKEINTLYNEMKNNIETAFDNDPDLKDTLDDLEKLNKSLLEKLRNIPQAVKIALIAIGSVLGLAAIASLLTPIKTIIASKRAKKLDAKAKPRAKGLIITSTALGLLTIAASTAIMIYVFVIQGGL